MRRSLTKHGLATTVAEVFSAFADAAAAQEDRSAGVDRFDRSPVVERPLPP